MKQKYRVNLEVKNSFAITIKAETEEKAKIAALVMWEQGFVKTPTDEASAIVTHIDKL